MSRPVEKMLLPNANNLGYCEESTPHCRMTYMSLVDNSKADPYKIH